MAISATDVPTKMQFSRTELVIMKQKNRLRGELIGGPLHFNSWFFKHLWHTYIFLFKFCIIASYCSLFGWSSSIFPQFRFGFIQFCNKSVYRANFFRPRGKKTNNLSNVEKRCSSRMCQRVRWLKLCGDHCLCFRFPIFRICHY